MIHLDILFDPSTQSTPHLRHMLTRPAPHDRYVIFFTPDSGSSWLTGIVEQSDRLGRAKEVFKPNFCNLHAQKHGIANLKRYIDYVMRRGNRGGDFGFEVEAPHIRQTFGGPGRFKHHFGADPAFWLIRQDIVAPAMSLAEVTATRTAADATLVYDPQAIQKWLTQILAAERLSERWFAKWGLRLLRMSYEQITALTPHQMVNVIARHAGLPVVPPVDTEPRH